MNEYLVKTIRYTLVGGQGQALPDPAQIQALLNQAAANRWRLEQTMTCATGQEGCLYLVFRNMGNASPID